MAVEEIERQQSSLGKFILGLPRTAPNLSTEVLLGLKPVRQILYSAQLKFYLRVQKQEGSRWSKDALLDHLQGTWHSPYIQFIHKIKQEVGMNRGPVSRQHVDLVLNYHFLRELNNKIFKVDLPGLRRVSKLGMTDYVDESQESQVDFGVGLYEL